MHDRNASKSCGLTVDVDTNHANGLTRMRQEQRIIPQTVIVRMLVVVNAEPATLLE
jgi:hypothetical protein